MELRARQPIRKMELRAHQPGRKMGFETRLPDRTRAFGFPLAFALNQAPRGPQANHKMESQAQ